MILSIEFWSKSSCGRRLVAMQCLKLSCMSASDPQRAILLHNLTHNLGVLFDVEGSVSLAP